MESCGESYEVTKNQMFNKVAGGTFFRGQDQLHRRWDINAKIEKR